MVYSVDVGGAVELGAWPRLGKCRDASVSRRRPDAIDVAAALVCRERPWSS